MIRYMDDPVYLKNEIKKWQDNYNIAQSKDDLEEMTRSLVFVKSNTEHLERLLNEI